MIADKALIDEFVDNICMNLRVDHNPGTGENTVTLGTWNVRTYCTAALTNRTVRCEADFVGRLTFTSNYDDDDIA